MLVLTLIIFGTGFTASSLPFLFPDSVVTAPGLALNHWLADVVAATLGPRGNSLVTGLPGIGTVPAGLTLTFEGVLVLYLPVLAIVLFILRGR